MRFHNPRIIDDIVKKVFSRQLDDTIGRTVDADELNDLQTLDSLMQMDYSTFALKDLDHRDIKPGREYPYYRRNRYDLEKRNRCGRYKNSDKSIIFQKQQNRLWLNPFISQLPRNNSDGLSEWISYNWVLYLDIDTNLFNIVFAQHDESRSAEIGLKHSMLALPNQIWSCGEMRILKLYDKWLYQFNLNSSINSTYSLDEHTIVKDHNISSHIFRKFMAQKIRMLIEYLLALEDESVSSIVQVVEELVTFVVHKYNTVAEIKNNNNLIIKGISPHYGSIDPVHGLIYYYYQSDECPSRQYADQLNKIGKSDFYYLLQDGGFNQFIIG